MERKYAWHNYDDATMEKVYALSDTYRQFLDNGKTERECVVQAVEFAEAKGYVNLNDIIKSNSSIKAGDKIYYTHMDKSIALFNIGTDDIELGMNILGAHIDSPRIDVKQNPQYEDSNLVFWDTHYYGGIKKYHWVAMPLAIHGVVVKTDGTRININIGDKETDPVFCITEMCIRDRMKLIKIKWLLWYVKCSTKIKKRALSISLKVQIDVYKRQTS